MSVFLVGPVLGGLAKERGQPSEMARSLWESSSEKLHFCLQVSGVLWMGGWLKKWWMRLKQEPLSGCPVAGFCGLAPPQRKEP